MMQIIPTNGPMADERLSELRSKCLQAWGKDGAPQVEVLDYLQFLEARYMEGVVNENREFLRSSIDQFRPKTPIRDARPLIEGRHLYLQPDDEVIEFMNCPIGLFHFNSQLYMNTGASGAYEVSSGDGFFGPHPQTNKNLEKCLVTPVRVIDRPE